MGFGVVGHLEEGPEHIVQKGVEIGQNFLEKSYRGLQ